MILFNSVWTVKVTFFFYQNLFLDKQVRTKSNEDIPANDQVLFFYKKQSNIKKVFAFFTIRM